MCIVKSADVCFCVLCEDVCFCAHSAVNTQWSWVERGCGGPPHRVWVGGGVCRIGVGEKKKGAEIENGKEKILVVCGVAKVATR